MAIIVIDQQFIVYSNFFECLRENENGRVLYINLKQTSRKSTLHLTEDWVKHYTEFALSKKQVRFNKTSLYKTQNTFRIGQIWLMHCLFKAV